MFISLGPTMAVEEDGEGQRRQRQPGIGDAHDDLVDPAAQVAGDDAERGADGAGEDDGGEAHHHRDPGAEDEPGQHVAAQMIGAEQMLAAAAGLPGRGMEARARALPISGS